MIDNILITTRELIDEKIVGEKRLGIIDGKSSVILFYLYYSKQFDDIDIYNKAFDLIEHVYNIIDLETTPGNFCSGIAGFCWLLEYIEQNNLMSDSFDEILYDIDDILIKHLQQFNNNNNHDFLYGSLGVGYYLNLRLNFTKFSNEKYVYAIAEHIKSLLSISIEDHIHIKWSSFTFKENPKNDIYFSLPHGFLGIYSIISQYCKNPTLAQNSGLKEIIRKAYNYLLNNFDPINKKRSSAYPLFESKQDFSTRLAWCNGDISTVISLLNMYESYNNNNGSILDLLIKTAEITCNRRDFNDTKIEDIFLCHGSLGLVNSYEAIYNITQIKTFNNAKQYWLDYSVRKIEADLSILRNADISLLNGLTGVGLTLLSEKNPSIRNWKKCLLIN